MACVLNNLPIDTEKVKQWLTDNCEKVVSTTEAVNEALAMVNLHHGHAKAIPVSGGGMYHGGYYALSSDWSPAGSPTLANGLLAPLPGRRGYLDRRGGGAFSREVEDRLQDAGRVVRARHGSGGIQGGR